MKHCVNVVDMQRPPSLDDLWKELDDVEYRRLKAFQVAATVDKEYRQLLQTIQIMQRLEKEKMGN